MTVTDVAPALVVHELKLSTIDMLWLARGLIAATAADESYGVKYHAHLTADQLGAVATSTDGFRVHQMTVALTEPVDLVDVIVPREALMWAQKNARTFKPKKDALIEPVAIMQIAVPFEKRKQGHPGWVSVIFREWDDADAPSARFDAPLVQGEFPTMGALIDRARDAEEAGPAPLALDFLADARTLQTPHTQVPVIRYTAGREGRPGPAVLDFWEGSVLRASALIQPTRTEEQE